MLHIHALEVVQTLMLGAAAGIVGGLAGVGGSLVMIPGLHFVFGSDPASRHHLYMAAAMMVNVAVAIPAARKHARAGAVHVHLLPSLLVSALCGMVGGVLTSNQFDGEKLKRWLAVAIVGYCGYLFVKIFTKSKEISADGVKPGVAQLVVSGGLSGFTGGVLGLGGGIVLVPMLQVLCGVRLRQAIGTSSAVICVTALIGAGIKTGTLAGHGESLAEAGVLAVLMAPTAMVGAVAGAALTHRLPLQWVRGAIAALLLAAALRLAGTW